MFIKRRKKQLPTQGRIDAAVEQLDANPHVMEARRRNDQERFERAGHDTPRTDAPAAWAAHARDGHSLDLFQFGTAQQFPYFVDLLKIGLTSIWYLLAKIGFDTAEIQPSQVGENL